VPKAAVACALPHADFVAARDELVAAGYEPIATETADDLERLLESRSDVGVAILDSEADLDITLEMYAILHEGGRNIPALLLMPPLTQGKMSLGGGRNESADEYFSRPFSAESLRYRIDAMLIRSGAIPAEEVVADQIAPAPTEAAAAAPAAPVAPAVPVAPTREIGRAAPAAPAPAAPAPAHAAEYAGLAKVGGTTTYYPPAAPVEPPDGSQRGRLIIVFNPKGGVGKTTVSINLGATLQIRKHFTVLLVDCDAVTGHVGPSLGMPQPRTLAEAWLWDHQKGIPEESAAQVAVPHSVGLDVLLVSATPFHTEVLVPERVAATLAAARGSYDFVILDLHPDFGLLNLELFQLADRIIVPVTPDVPCMLAAVQFREVARALGILDRLLLVINRADSGIAPAKVEKAIGIPTLARIRSGGTLFFKASDAGVSAVEGSPGAKAVGDMAQLADRLLTALESGAHGGVGNQARGGIAESVRALLDRVTG
jgi:MinD-like ATPase involved in chromosome partitioning or flagellar assembly